LFWVRNFVTGQIQQNSNTRFEKSAMLTLEEALAGILAALPAPGSERVRVLNAFQRVLAEDVLAPVALPTFDNSSMDGYAARSADTASANPHQPVSLRLIGRVAAGEHFHGEIKTGECVRIFTGSPLPAGADAVVMQEDTRVEPQSPDEIFILEPVKPWENVRFRGEDIKCNTLVGRPGEWLNAARIGLLNAVGTGEVSVNRRPLVGLLATGSELKEAGEPLLPGQIYESNRAALAPLIQNAGGIPKMFPIVSDDPEATSIALEKAFSDSDIVVTCGGVSVGEMDFVKSAFEQLGGNLQFWKVAIKPGKPFVFGRCGEKFLFGLPGNPVSAFVTFLLLVRPALLRWQGAHELGLPVSPGTLFEPLENSGSRRHFMRVILDSEGGVRSAGIQASHILRSLASANGLVDVPPQTSFPVGSVVRVLRWD
jgi:molybdopterin molybdotransferase